MKKIGFLFVLGTIVFSSCNRHNYTCPVYSKSKAKASEGYVSAAKVEKTNM